MSLRFQITAVCLLIAGCSGSVIGYGIYATSVVTKLFTHVSSINLPNSESLGDMGSTKQAIHIGILNWMSDTHRRKEFAADVRDLISRYEKADEWYQSIPFVPGEGEIYQKVQNTWKSFKTNILMILAGESNGNELLSSSAAYDKELDELIQFQGLEAKKNSELAIEEADFSKVLQFCLFSILFLASIVLSFVLGKKIASRIQETVERLTKNADLVSAEAHQIASSSQNLAQSTTEQSAALQETSSALEEISSMISKSTESIESTANSAISAKQKAEMGREAVDRMKGAVGLISQGNEETLGHVMDSNQRMLDILKIIEEIAVKTKIIDDIVFQTKLLSFNASVEAARAGENGKGFSVVAQEVGALAQLSGNAAKEITEMLNKSTQFVKQITDDTEKKVDVLVKNGKQRIEVGLTTAETCAQLLQEIVGQASQVSSLAVEITKANQEQSLGVSEINKAMAQLDSVTQQNASISREASVAADTLSNQASALKQSISDLVSVIEGSRAQGSKEGVSKTFATGKEGAFMVAPGKSDEVSGFIEDQDSAA